MFILIVICAIITILNFVIVFPAFLKDAKEEPGLKSMTIVIFLMMILPLFSAIVLFLFSKERYPLYKEKKEKEKYLKKHPELASLNTLKDIHKIYLDKITNIVDDGFKKRLVSIEIKLKWLVTTIEANIRKPEYVRILSLYELTFALIKTTIEESEQINDELTNEILLVSRDSIEQITLEVEQLSNKEVIFEKETMQAIKKTFVSRLKEDQDYHSKRIGNSI